MAFTLKTVLDDGGADLSVGLNQATSYLKAQIMTRKSMANIKEFEAYLNSIYHPKNISSNSSSKAFQYYSKVLKEINVESITHIFNAFDFERNAPTSKRYGRTGSIRYSSLEKEVSMMKNTLNQLDKGGKKGLIKNFSKINALVTDGENILKIAEEAFFKKGKTNIGNLSMKNYVEDNVVKKAIDIVNQLDVLNHLISSGVSPQEAGTLFEMALQKADYYKTATEDVRQEIIDDILIEFLHGRGRRGGASTIGQQTVGRGILGMNISAQVSKSSKFKDSSFGKNFAISSGDYRVKITYNYNPNEQKQGKMDVQMIFGDGPLSDFRISAKRWSQGKGDFGSTSVDAGIVRAGGYGVAEAYKLAVLTPKRDMYDGTVPASSAVNAAHEFAKLALKSDILMGINQGESVGGGGYANLVVIDTGSKIVVRNLADLILKDQVNLSGYNEGGIQSAAANTYYRLSLLDYNRTITYLKRMTSVLNSMKVTINYKV